MTFFFLKRMLMREKDRQRPWKEDLFSTRITKIFTNERQKRK